MNRRFPRLADQLGVGCIVAGILIIALAWNGAAGVDFVQGQVPYLLSGGGIGIALCIIGAALLVIQNNRRDRALLEAQLTELNTAVGRLANAVASLTAGATNGGGASAGGSTRRRGRAAGDATDTSARREVVVIGRSSFHRPDCRLVAGKDLATSTAEAALQDGLSACRICQPASVPASAG